uniref:Amino acid transporter transmembrane domain-containing protein n=1 Tax=Chenopodium quinoa TaxID=63459 RepID=A0A803KVP1_CHEQI
MKENVEVVKKENNEGEDSLNRWLAVTANRKGKWWYAAIHNVTGMVGAGILGLPYAMSQLGCLVEDNVMISFEKPVWLIAAANIFVVIHVIGSYHVYAIPVFDMLESFMVLKMKFQPSRKLRIITRGTYVGFTMFIGIAFPFFGSLLSVLGGIAFAPTSFYLPCIIWLIIRKPEKYSLSWFLNWAFIIYGVSLTILAPIGAIRDIVVQCGTFKFFS